MGAQLRGRRLPGQGARPLRPRWRIVYGLLTCSNAAQGITQLRVQVIPATASAAKGETILALPIAIPNSYGDLFTLDVSRF